MYLKQVTQQNICTTEIQEQINSNLLSNCIMKTVFLKTLNIQTELFYINLLY